MYPYFALKAVNVHIPRIVSNFITTCQLTQMLIGLFVNMYTVYLISKLWFWYNKKIFVNTKVV